MTREEAIEIINRENDSNDKKIWEIFPKCREALDMAISALEQITQIRKAIVEAEEENLHLSYPVWCFMRKIEKIVGEKEMGEFDNDPCDAISREAVQIAMALDNISDIAKEIKKKLPSVQPKPIECEDAISREAVMGLVAREHSEWDDLYIVTCYWFTN